ncbi:Fe-S cluster assembly protein SufD [Synechococcus sp. BDU 130192]|uniref:Fe-S cluster assembly protein SufD n=1 Tax=Synechococcus sp. BDU 130192 TaxID=2042059 RepID=UPI000C074283|nr:Fe-S cluster assembly protein SufD [Synechococcus sp. BDU 130192]
MSSGTMTAAIAFSQSQPTEVDPNLEKFLGLLDRNQSAEFQAIRDQGLEKVRQGKFPSRRDEAWRVTDLSVLKNTAFQAAQPTTPTAADLEVFALPETTNSRLVFVNGHYAPDQSCVSGLPDSVFVGNFTALATAQKAAIAKYLGQQTQQLDVFAALNDAGLGDLAIVWVPKNTVVEQPIQLLFLGNGADQPTAMQSRCLVIAETGAQANVVEYYGAIAQGCTDQDTHRYFNNALTEVWVQANARLNHVRVQREAGGAIHLGNTAIAQAQDSHYQLTEVNFGAQLSRHTLTLTQNGPQTETILKGLTMVGAEQLSDTHTAVYLQHPYGSVDQLHKCIIDDAARSVFNGQIHVPQKAQMTNAAQLNRNLLLSPKAKVDTKPELQITADNVKCAHGATVSQLEAEEIFYLRSRGLNDYDARHLLIDAFAAEILDTVAIAHLQQALTGCVACRTVD